jgi:hypothetical protein
VRLWYLAVAERAGPFAYASFAGDEHESALPLAGLARVLIQRGQLALPLDQPHSLIVRRIDVLDHPVD